MSRTPHQRALLRRTALALCLIGTGGFQGARLVQVRLGLDSAYPVSVVLVFAAAAALVLASVSSQHPFTRFGPANGVTSVRLMLTSLVAGLALGVIADAWGWRGFNRSATGTPETPA